jgi:two-component system, response regulator YesN
VLETLSYNRRLHRIYEHLLSLPPGKRLSLQQAAKIAGMHPNALTRRCARELGLSYGKFAQLVALERAIDLFQKANYSVDEVAWLVGYESSSGFRRLFRRHLRMSPGRYKQEYGKPKRQGPPGRERERERRRLGNGIGPGAVQENNTG